MSEIFNQELQKVGLGPEAVSVLRGAGIKYVAQLLQLQHIRQVSGLGRGGKTAISLFLQRHGLRLGTDIEDWEPPGSSTTTNRVKNIGPPKDGSIYKVLLIGGEKRGKDQVKGPLSKRRAIVEWHWTVDKKRQRHTVKGFPKGCDLVLRMGDLAATMTNVYRVLAKKEGIAFLSITRKKAQWAPLLDELGLKEHRLSVEDFIQQEKETEKRKAVEKREAEERIAQETVQATVDDETRIQEAAQRAEEELAERAAAAAHLAQKATQQAQEEVDGLFPPPDAEEVEKPTDQAIQAAFKEPSQPLPSADSTVYEGGGHTLAPIAREVADLMARNKMRHAVFTVAQRVDRIASTFEGLLPLLVDAMKREGIRGLIVTGGGKSVEYTTREESSK